MKQTILSMMIGVALSVSAAVAEAKPGHQHNDFRDMLKQLSLTDEQKQQLRSAMKTHGDHDAEQRKQRKGMQQQNMAQMKDLLQAATFDEAAVRQLVQQSMASRSKSMFKRASRRAALASVLDDQQESALQAMVDLRTRSAGEKMDKYSQRWMTKLGLDSEQQATVEMLNENRKAQVAANMATMQDFHNAEKILLGSGNFSEQSWQALFEQYQPQFVEAGVQKAAHRQQIWQVLTEEQRDAVAERAAQRKHRGKRNGR